MLRTLSLRTISRPILPASSQIRNHIFTSSSQSTFAVTDEGRAVEATKVKQARQRKFFRLERALISSLLLSADRHLTSANCDPDAVIKHILERMAQSRFIYSPSRGVAWHALISLLFRRRHFRGVLELFKAMRKEGFLPSQTVAARIRAMIIARMMLVRDEDEGDKDLGKGVDSESKEEEVDKEAALPSLKEIFSSESFDEASFRQLLQFIHDELELRGVVIGDIVATFMDTRPEGYIPSTELLTQLIAINTRAGMLKTTEELLDKHSQRIKLAKRPLGPKEAAPYATLMRVLSDVSVAKGTSANISAVLDNILVRMKEDGVPPDLAIFNTLISSTALREDYEASFSLYTYLLGAKNPVMIPDSFTFGSVFKSVYAIMRARTIRSHRHKTPINMLAPRQLYSELIGCHYAHYGKVKMRAPRPVITVPILQAALRVFMLLGDYAGAFVVVRSFKIFGYQPNVHTYHIIIKGLVIRARKELKSAAIKSRTRAETDHGRSTKKSWTDRILGIDSQNMALFNEKSSDAELIGRILELHTSTLQEQRIRLSPIHVEVHKEQDSESTDKESPASPGRVVRDPSASFLTDDLTSYPPTLHGGFDVRPLERLLRRALTADIITNPDSHLNISQPDARSTKAALPKGNIVSLAIVTAKQEMIPIVPQKLYTASKKDRRTKRTRLIGQLFGHPTTET